MLIVIVIAAQAQKKKLIAVGAYTSSSIDASAFANAFQVASCEKAPRQD